jgi:hypothetical protein
MIDIGIVESGPRERGKEQQGTEDTPMMRRDWTRFAKVSGYEKDAGKQQLPMSIRKVLESPIEMSLPVSPSYRLLTTLRSESSRVRGRLISQDVVDLLHNLICQFWEKV